MRRAGGRCGLGRSRTAATALVALLAGIMLVGAGVTAATAAEVAARAGAGERPQVLRFANTDIPGLEELQREFAAFERALESALGMPVELFPVPNRTAVAAALESGQVDLVLTGPAEYVAIRATTRVVPVLGLTRPGYRSVIVTRTDTGITSLQQLRGKRVGMEVVGSTSAHLGPTNMLVEAGLQPGRDVEVLFLGGGLVAAFASGEVEAAGMGWHDYERLINQFGREHFRLLQVSPDLPNDIFIARPDLDPAFIDTLRRRLLDHERPLIQALVTQGENAKYVQSRFAPAQDSDYDPIVRAYEAIGVYDFSNYAR